MILLFQERGGDASLDFLKNLATFRRDSAIRSPSPPRDIPIHPAASLSMLTITACVFQGNVVEEVVDSGQNMADEALFKVK